MCSQFLLEYLCGRVECQSLAGASLGNSLRTLLDCVLHKEGFYWHLLKHKNYMADCTYASTTLAAVVVWLCAVMSFNGL